MCIYLVFRIDVVQIYGIYKPNMKIFKSNMSTELCSSSYKSDTHDTFKNAIYYTKNLSQLTHTFHCWYVTLYSTGVCLFPASRGWLQVQGCQQIQCFYLLINKRGKQWTCERSYGRRHQTTGGNKHRLLNSRHLL